MTRTSWLDLDGRRVDVGAHVHEHNGRWVVAEYRDGRFYAPMRREDRRLTGATTVYGSLDYVIGNAYSCARRSDAIRRAAEVYGWERAP